MPIETVESDGGILINISGSFDRSTSNELEEVLKDRGTAGKPVVVNLWDVNYISSVSIGTLIKLQGELAEREVSIGVCQLSDECQKIFDMVEIGKVLPIYESDDDAFRGLTS